MWYLDLSKRVSNFVLCHQTAVFIACSLSTLSRVWSRSTQDILDTVMLTRDVKSSDSLCIGYANTFPTYQGIETQEQFNQTILQHRGVKNDLCIRTRPTFILFTGIYTASNKSPVEIAAIQLIQSGCNIGFDNWPCILRNLMKHLWSLIMIMMHSRAN